MEPETKIFTALDVPYRGKRQYVHGTDIFALIGQCLQAVSISRIQRLDLKFSQPVVGSFDIEVSPARTDTIAVSPVQMSFVADAAEFHLGILPRESEPRRLDNDRETRLASQLITSSGVYSVGDQGAYTVIEKIVFINKHMLLREIPEVSDWFFGRLRVESFDFESAYDVALKVGSITGTGLACSDLLLDSTVAGDVIFLPRS